MVPEGYKPSKLVILLSSIFLGLLFIYFVYSQFKRHIAFSGKVRYTIATTSKKYMTSSGRDMDYIYQVNGRTYVGTATFAYKSKVPNGKYWVKYSVQYPDISRIYQNLPVDSRIDTLPSNGFKRMYSYKEFLKWKEWASQQKKENK